MDLMELAKGIKTNYSDFSDQEISLKVIERDGDKVKSRIEIARTVDGIHPYFGRVTITKETLVSFKKNFDSKVFGKDIVFDFDHEEREAAGWPKSLELSKDGEKLFAFVDWTPKGFESLSNREFRYFSPQFTLNFIKADGGEEFGPTLTGGGITNKPFLDMEALVSLSAKQKGTVKMDTINLSDHNAAISKKDAEISELKLSVANLETASKAVEGRNEVISKELEEMKSKIELSEKTSAFEVLLSAGKACEAQREAYMAGDMIKFAENAAKLNTEPKGNGGNDDVDGYVLSDAEKKMCLNLGLTEDAYLKHNGLGKYKV